MTIRNKIFIYFSTTVIGLTLTSLLFIYLLFAEYREEEFQQQQNEKIHTTIKLIEKFKQESAMIADLIDQQHINDFYDEKLLVFDSEKKLIFSSLDNLQIDQAEKILSMLTPDNPWIETKEGNYDLIGVYMERKSKQYYAVSKAYDAFGYSKMYFLRNVLIAIFLFISIVVILTSLIISKKISKPITTLAATLKEFNLSKDKAEAIQITTSAHEVNLLTQSFNDLLKRTSDAFAFQKHTAHHISHQLKTPIAVLVSELERIKDHTQIDEIKREIEIQTEKAKNLGSIINVLLEISKIEYGQYPQKQTIRIDELIFDIIDEICVLNTNFIFEVNYMPDEMNENKLLIPLNTLLVRQAFQNLLTNCVAYSNNSKAEIRIDSSEDNELLIKIINSGKPITKEEESYLFKYFFRGKNSFGISGYGLGLVLTKKIMELNSASISYSNPSPNLNIFEIRFPLS
jgi:two-component system sensor histidine kinase ArlS